MSESKMLRLIVSKAPDGRAKIQAIVGDVVVAADVIDLWLDPERDRFANAIHAAVPALPLLSIQRELLTIGRDNLPTVDSPDDPWPDPMSIDRPILPAFPVEQLPEPLQSWVVATAEACQVPVDLPALLALTVCAGAVARRIEVMAGREWYEPLNIFTATLLEPANRKSAVFSAALKPIREIEQELIEEAKPTHAKLASARRCKEKRLAKLEKRAGESGDTKAMHEAAQLAEELSSEPVPSLPKLIVDDATAEAVEAHLAAQGGRLFVAGCEGGLFDVMAGRYSSGMGNLDCFLKGHAGDDLLVDRVTRSIMINRCCLTMGYAVQPDVIRAMAERPSFRSRGLMGRFLYAIPESRLGLRRVNAEPVSSGVSRDYDALVRRLAAIPEATQSERWIVRMSPCASTCFHDWQVKVETMLSDSGRMAEFRDWGGKLCGLTARLAAILHLVSVNEQSPWEIPISGSVMESAIAISQWAIDHAEAVIGLTTGARRGLDDAAYILRWIRESERKEFARRDAQVHARSRFDGEPEKLDAALELLVDHGWIRPVTTTARSGPGRPRSQRFQVNPIAGRRSAPIVPASDVVIKPPARVRGVM